MIEDAPPAATEAVARLWLDTLGTLAGRAAHDLRGALNGVAVNLEVVRSRLARGAEAGAVGAFAETAAAQMEILAPRVEALLAFNRPARAPLDVREVVDRLMQLLGPPLATAGGELAWGESDGDPAPTGADPEAARLVLAAVLLAATARPTSVICRLRRQDAIILQVDSGESPEPLAAALQRAAIDARIPIACSGHTTTITLPALAR